MTVSAFRKIVGLGLVLTVLGGCASRVDRDAAIADSFQQVAVSAEANGNYAAAVNHYARLRKSRPHDLGALLGLARNLRYSGAAKAAVETLAREAKDFGDDARFLLETGKAKLAVGDATGAAKSLTASIAKDAGNWEAHAALGIAHDLLESYGDARKAYQTALKLSGNDPTVLNNMAISSALAGDIDLAIRTLENAPPAARNTPQIRQNLALFYGIKGDLDRAEALARVDLDEASVLNNMAVYSRLRGNQTKAVPPPTTPPTTQATPAK